jgi:hypothetical protein
MLCENLFCSASRFLMLTKGVVKLDSNISQRKFFIFSVAKLILRLLMN